MNGITFLILLLIILIFMIIFIFIFQTYMFMSLKSYHEKWEPVYENKKEHFDKYLKKALEHRYNNQTIENLALYAAVMNYNDNREKLKQIQKSIHIEYINNKREDYIHELRSAGIE